MSFSHPPGPALQPPGFHQPAAASSASSELLVKSSIKTLTSLFFSGGIQQKTPQTQNFFSPLKISIITVPERDFCIQQNWQDEVEADIGLIEEVGCGGNNGNNGGFGEEKGVYNYSPRGEIINRSKASSPDSISKNVEDIRSSPESGAKPRSSLGESEKAAISRPSGAAGEGGVEADGKAWLESALFDLNLPPPEHLNQHRRVVEMMDIPTLIYEKKRVKDKLKDYDTWFQQSVYSNRREKEPKGREPNRREKEPMRPLYTYYRLVKMFLEARQGEVAGSATNSTRGGLGGNYAAEELVPAPGMKGEVERFGGSRRWGEHVVGESPGATGSTSPRQKVGSQNHAPATSSGAGGPQQRNSGTRDARQQYGVPHMGGSPAESSSSVPGQSPPSSGASPGSHPFHAVGSPSAQEQYAPDSYPLRSPDNGIREGRRERERREMEHSQSPPPARQRRSQTAGVAGSLVIPKASPSASAHTGTSVEVQHLVSRRQELLRQKSRIRETLQSYQERFLQEHQRKIRYHRDILPIESEYKNYKNIKLQLQEVERALGVDLPAA